MLVLLGKSIYSFRENTKADFCVDSIGSSSDNIVLTINLPKGERGKKKKKYLFKYLIKLFFHFISLWISQVFGEPVTSRYL